MSGRRDDRKSCPYCDQYLAVSAYYRHLNDKVGSICPGKSVGRCPMEMQAESTDSEEDSSVLCSGSETVSAISESSFDFESPTEGSLPAGTAHISNANDNYDSVVLNETVMDDDDIITSSSSDFEFESDFDEEIMGYH